MNTLLTQAIEHWAEEKPNHPAFRFAGDNLGYRQLWQRAEQLARVLIDNDVQHGDRIGIYMDKCLETAVAVYGIMRAGAAFVPLDASAPAARIEHMISHCGIRVLVSHPPKATNLNAMLDGLDTIDCIVGIDDRNAQYSTVAWPSVHSVSVPAPDVEIGEHDLAYIMYTSGSTGVPKGIMHSHFSGLSYARMAAQTYALNDNDRLGNHSPLHFDMSTLDYFAGPLVGATTVIIPEAYTKFPASLSQLIQTEKLTIWYSVPYALIQLLTRGVLEKRDASTIRWVLFGGEPFHSQHLYSLKKHWPHARFSNVYGPAEVNQCTYYHVPDSPHNSATKVNHPIPIGKVWDGAKALVVDEFDEHVAAGETGELLIHAPTMMQGYWNQKALNATAFYLCPLADGQSRQYYRTGDLVKLNTDGLLEFIGRKDRQIKVRGYRIELDEIENVLAAHPDVVETCVYSLQLDDEPRHIDAAVIIRDLADINTDDLRDFVAQRLAQYALPSQFFIYPSFPRTTSGKVDRRAIQTEAMLRSAHGVVE